MFLNLAQFYGSFHPGRAERRGLRGGIAARQLRWHEIRRRESEGRQKFLPSNPLPFRPPEQKLSKVSVGIFAEKVLIFIDSLTS